MLRRDPFCIIIYIFQNAAPFSINIKKKFGRIFSYVDYLRKLDYVPKDVRKSLKKINAVRDALASELGREPTDGEIAGRLGVSMEQYYDTVHKD